MTDFMECPELGVEWPLDRVPDRAVILQRRIMGYSLF
jgi:hypothetical protein